MKGIKTYIYGLKNSNDEIFYVGKTHAPKTRLINHRQTIKGIDTLEILDIFYDKEKDWINKLLNEGAKLINRETSAVVEDWEIGDIISVSSINTYRVINEETNTEYGSMLAAYRDSPKEVVYETFKYRLQKNKIVPPYRLVD